MTLDTPYVPIAVRLLYGDLLASTSPEKQVRAAELLRQYPQLATPAASAPTSFRSRIPTEAWELSFEATHLVPVLDTAEFQYKRQYTVMVRVGRNFYQGRIDFYLHDDAGVLGIIESKRSITDSSELAETVAQAKSYALPIGAPSFLIAAPQGVWLYTLHRTQETLQRTYTIATFRKGGRHLLRFCEAIANTVPAAQHRLAPAPRPGRFCGVGSCYNRCSIQRMRLPGRRVNANRSTLSILVATAQRIEMRSVKAWRGFSNITLYVQPCKNPYAWIPKSVALNFAFQCAKSNLTSD